MLDFEINCKFVQGSRARVHKSNLVSLQEFRTLQQGLNCVDWKAVLHRLNAHHIEQFLFEDVVMQLVRPGSSYSVI